MQPVEAAGGTLEVCTEEPRPAPEALVRTPARRKTPILLETDDGPTSPVAGTLWGQPEAPRNLDRPDLMTSVQLMSASFRGSAAAAPVAVAAVPTRPVPPQHNGSPAQTHGSQRSTMLRRSGSGANVAPLSPQTLLGSGPQYGPPATPKHGDRPDLNSSMQFMSPAFRGSAAAVPVPPAHPATPSGSSRPRPSTAPGFYPQGLQARLGCPVAPLVLNSSYAVACDVADAAECHVPGSLPTPTNADRKIMMARSSRSVRGNVLVSRFDREEAQLCASSNGGCAAAPPQTQAAPATAALSGSCDVGEPPRPITAPPAPSAGAQTPFRRKLSNPALGVEVVQVPGGTASWDSGPLAAPKNGDRRDLGGSLRMGTPAFRGSGAAPPGVGCGAGTAPLASPVVLAAPRTSSSVGRCTPKA